MGSQTPPNGSESLATELWRHPDPTSTRMYEFKEIVNKKYNLDLDSYDDLYKWSIENIAEFWEETWWLTGIKAERGFDMVRRELVFASSCDGHDSLSWDIGLYTR